MITNRPFFRPYRARFLLGKIFGSNVPVCLSNKPQTRCFPVFIGIGLVAEVYFFRRRLNCATKGRCLRDALVVSVLLKAHKGNQATAGEPKIFYRQALPIVRLHASGNTSRARSRMLYSNIMVHAAIEILSTMANI